MQSGASSFLFLPSLLNDKILSINSSVSSVNMKLSILLKSQITTRTNGTVVADYTYGKQKEFGLPDELTFSVDVKKFKIPKGVVIDINRTAIAPVNTRKTGQIHLFLTNYVINQGIEDRIFKE